MSSPDKQEVRRDFPIPSVQQLYDGFDRVVTNGIYISRPVQQQRLFFGKERIGSFINLNRQYGPKGEKKDFVDTVQALYHEAPSEHVISIGITDSNPEMVRRLAEAHKIPYSAEGAIRVNYYILGNGIVERVTSYQKGDTSTTENVLADELREVSDSELIYLQALQAQLEFGSLMQGEGVTAIAQVTARARVSGPPNTDGLIPFTFVDPEE